MGVNSNQYLQGINQTTGTGAPVHSAVAGDRYTDTATGTTYQYTTSWQTVSYSAGALVYFSEAQSTASPNATVNVDSLTAIATSTNADFVIKPKGTGAIIGNIPDDATLGGNKRGAKAIDLQLLRGSSNQVASGTSSALIGGENNRASGAQSIGLAGYNNVASNTYSVVTGLSCISSGIGSFAGGSSVTSAGENSFAFGLSAYTNAYAGIAIGAGAYASANHAVSIGKANNATGDSSFGTGSTNVSSGENSFTANTLNTASGMSSFVIGEFGSSFGVINRFVVSGRSNILGSSQLSRLPLGLRTTNDTPSALVIQYPYGTTPVASNQLTLQNNNSIRFKGTIIGRQSGSTNTSAWDIDGIIQRGTSAATTTLLISNVNVVQNTPTFGTPTLTANTTLGCLTVTVIGVAATNIQWTCGIDTTEVIYA